MVGLLSRVYHHHYDEDPSGGLRDEELKAPSGDVSGDASEAESMGSSHRSLNESSGPDDFDADLESISSYTRRSRSSSMSHATEAATDDDDDDDDDEDRDDDFTDGEAGRGAAGLKFASEARNKEFHKLFGEADVPASERLHKVFVCALSKEILYHGRMYITPNYLCFHSRVFVTHHIVVRISDITKIEKKMTISFIPNAIAIHTTQGQKYLFASFSKRDHVVAVLRRLRNEKPQFASPGAADDSSVIRSRQGSRAVGAAALAPVSSAHSERVRSSSMSQRSSNGGALVHQAVAAVNGLFDTGSADANAKQQMATQTKQRSATNGTVAPASPAAAGSPTAAAGGAGGGGAGGSGTKWPVENIGPETHAPVAMPSPNSNEKVLATETIAAPLGVVANLLFGKDTTWLKHFLVDVEHNRELDSLPPFPDFKPGAERYFEYTKPLNGAVGPKQTRCKSTEKIEQWDTEGYIEVITTTATPNVPSGDSFTTLTRAVIAWGSNNHTEIRLGTWLDWTSKSWLKGPIEKGAIDGQTTYCKDLVAELGSKLAGGAKAGGAGQPAAVAKDEAGTSVASEKPKSSRRTTSAHEAAEAVKEWQQVSVGLGIALFVVFVLLIWSWRSGRSASRRTPEDFAELQLIEQELQLWQWVDDRSNQYVQQRRKLSSIEVEEAIKATEEKLVHLKASLCI